MSEKKRVAVLMGGANAEHDISMLSGSMVVEHLPPDRYEAIPIHIAKDGSWYFRPPNGPPISFADAMPALSALSMDCVFIALHGPFGEDGRIQAALDLLQIPYTGSGSGASALAIDKTRAKAVVSGAGIRVARQIEIGGHDWDASRDGATGKIADIGFPCVVKSPCLGSSLGMAIVEDTAALPGGVAVVREHGDRIMVEQFVEGTELTCGVLDVGDGPVALPVTEIRPKSDGYFDYDAKYTPGATDEITPAEIPGDVAEEVRDIAVRAHEIIGCRGFSRSDIFWTGDGLVWLEINTIPGLTQMSLFPKGARAVGTSFPELLGLLVDAARWG
ncbi:MAG: D-alanine--D-alanine ligase [Candidatus Hydrogenedentes bacterium]|nr:D-alanine--D-alanine ligase [Candidatus Hydrogenedentota bacterium]